MAAACLIQRAGGLAVMLAALSSTPTVGGQEPAEVGAAAFRFGPYRSTISDLSDPTQVDVALDGTIAVLEAGHGRVSIFSPQGERLRSIGRAGSGDGELLRPAGLAISDDGSLWIADTGNHRIQVFDAEGRRLHGWGGYGNEPGLFNEPRGIAVRDARVYVADLGNARIQVFDREGTPLLAFGSPGRETGRFNRPLDVAVDEDGFVYVADADNNRVQKFDADGTFVTSWGDWGPFAGLMDEPSGIVYRSGRLYVADRRNHRVQVFDRAGAFLEQWGTHAIRPHEGDGVLHYPDDLAITGAFAVICESFENRCQIFEAAPVGTAPQSGPPLASRKVKAHFGERIDVDGTLLTVAEPENHRVYLFESSGEIPFVIGDFGDRGTRPGLMLRIAGLELRAAERVLLVTDTATRRVQRFRFTYDPTNPAYDRRRARFSRAYDLAGSTRVSSDERVRWPIEPGGIERDASGNIYVLDARNSMILVFDPALELLRAWGGYGTEPGWFRSPTDLAIAGETVFVVDSNNHRVQVFDLEGRFLRAWGEPGEGRGQFSRPFGVAVAADGSVFVSDAAAHRVQKFDDRGAFVTAWGRLGTDHGEFWKPKGVAVDERQRLFVVDYGNHRIQIFTVDGRWEVTFGTGRAYSRSTMRGRRP